MTPEETREAIDTWLDENWPVIVGKQNAYFMLNGRFFQMLRSHSASATPADGEETAPDNLLAHPPYQSENWLDLSVPYTPLAALKIFWYAGDDGPGWYVILEVKLEGAVWQRIKAWGPEPWYQADWYNTEAR